MSNIRLVIRPAPQIRTIVRGTSQPGTGGSGTPLTVTEVDNSPSVVTTRIRFPNGSVTDNGAGDVTVNAVGATGATGATGAAGPNTLSGSTTTALNGLITGNGSNVGVIAPGAGVAAALAIAVGSAGGPVVNGGAIGTANGTSLSFGTGSLDPLLIKSASSGTVRSRLVGFDQCYFSSGYFGAGAVSGAAVPSTGAYGWSNNVTDAQATTDTFLSRNAAGVVQIGTTGSNALGSLLAANATLSGTLGVTGKTTFGDSVIHAPSTIAGLPLASTANGETRRLTDDNNRIVTSNGTVWHYEGTRFAVGTSAPVNYPPSTLSALLAISPTAGVTRYRVTDAVPAQRVAYADGTNWRYVDNNQVADTSLLSYTPSGASPSQTITLDRGPIQTLNLGSVTSGTAAITLTRPGVANGMLIIKQGATARAITVTLSAGTLRWQGTIPALNSDAANTQRIYAWVCDGTDVTLAPSEVSS